MNTDTTPRNPYTDKPNGERRNGAVAHVLGFFKFDHLPPYLQAVSKPCGELALKLADELPEGPELTVGLRKLLEAKDCFVRAML